ncbi:hypoxanthine-guanine phosphoribosyltransferase [Ceratobasidium sp. 414]|nr:hypoxanthine-guanine phosphoribosyltransferase [Ceratobasidium sp. 414]
MSQEHDGHLRATYNEIHMLIGAAAQRIEKEFAPDLFVAIGEHLSTIFIYLFHLHVPSGGGGFFPARVLRTFLKHPQSKKNISIQAIGLSLYEELPSTTAEQIANEVVRTQWLSVFLFYNLLLADHPFSGPETKTLLGRRVLIIRDVEKELLALPEAERGAMRPKFAVFVVHNKLKPKNGSLPSDVPYFAGEEIEDVWFDYPWEIRDVYEHDRMAELGRKLQESKRA